MEFITREQQQAAHALMAEIGDHIGYLSKGYAYQAIKMAYMIAIDEVFSLKLDICTQEQFEDFYRFLMDIALDYGVVTNHPLVPFDDLEKWSIHCLKNGKCIVTGANNGMMYWIDEPVKNSYEKPNLKKYSRISLGADYVKEIKEIGYDQFRKKYPTCIAIRCKLEGEE